jgi:hypothetical protein
MFMVAYSLGATGMLQISKEEFIDGMNNLKYIPNLIHLTSLQIRFRTKVTRESTKIQERPC